MSMTKISVGIQRSRNGLLVRVQAAPEVEDFFAAEGQPVNCTLLTGRMWTPLKDAGPLMVYPINPRLKGMQHHNNGAYRLDLPNLPLETENGEINLSLLRMQGIANPGGVQFFYSGVMSASGIAQWVNQSKYAASRFYLDYLKPINMNLVVSVKES